MNPKLVVVYQNSMGDGPPRIEFKRHDTLAAVSCVDCAAFTSEGTCMMGYARCWPLGRVCCSQWSLRTTPHETKPCTGGCGRSLPKYLTNRDACAECEQLRRLQRTFP